MKKLNITFCSFPDYSGNAKALYEYMVKRYKDKMNYTWIVYNEDSVHLLKKYNIKSILIGTDEFKSYIPKTNVFFTTQGNLDRDKEKTKNGLYVELWHGIGYKNVGYLCKKPSYNDVIGYKHMSQIIDYFIVPSEFWKVVYAAKMNIPANRIVSLGMPRLDYLLEKDSRKKLQSIIDVDLDKYKKIIYYLPTYKKAFDHDEKSEYDKNIFSIRKYNEKELDDYLKKNKYLLVVKRHPAEQKEYLNINSDNIINLNDLILSNKKLSINEILDAADLLITDYSSVALDFLFLNKPILYCYGDLDSYLDNRGIVFENYDFWCAGPKFDNILSFMTESKKLLEDKNYYREIRNEKKTLWYSDLKNGGCKNICDYFFDEEGRIQKNIKIYDDIELKYKRENENLHIEMDKIERENSKLKKDLEIRENEINVIVNSKSWKIMEKIRKIIRR